MTIAALGWLLIERPRPPSPSGPAGSQELASPAPGLDCASLQVGDGTLDAGGDLRYQYSPVTEGEGVLETNWCRPSCASGFDLAIGTTPGGDDVLPLVDVGAATSYRARGLSLRGAWEGVTYFVQVTPRGEGCASGVSNGVQIAEAPSWDGRSTVGLRGGFSTGRPQSREPDFYGAHDFERVHIPAGVTTSVQGFGRVDHTPPGVPVLDRRAQSPGDGWLAIYANDIRVDGVITASGRGFGGGGGGGGGGSELLGLPEDERRDDQALLRRALGRAPWT